VLLFQRNSFLQRHGAGAAYEWLTSFVQYQEAVDAPPLLDDLPWDGIDTDEAEEAEHSALGLFMSPSVVETQSFLILGPFNTGTNLLRSLVRRNFGVFPDNMSDKEHWILWKHSRPAYAVQDVDDKAIVVMVRDPLSWLQSIRKAPYNFEPCMKGWGTMKRWLTNPCEMKTNTTSNASLLVHPSVALPNLESFWNLWYEEYAQFTTKTSNSVVFVRYEDLVLNPEGELNRVATAIGAAPVAQLKHVDQPAKHHGKPNGRAVALEKLQTKSYLELYSPTERSQACARLNRDLMHDYHYADCDGLPDGQQRFDA
jgi:hypothetical protein